MGQRGRPRHPDVLTPREQDVLALVRDGLTNEQIAERLDIGFETAKSHVAEILSKLNVATREQAAAWQPEPRQSRWAAWPVLGKVALFCAAAIVLAALAFLGFEVLRTDDGNEATTSPSPGATGSASPSPTATPQVVALDSAQSVYFLRQDGDIYTVPAGGGTLTKFAEGDTCTAGTLSNTWNLDWSPDGDLLACTGSVGNTSLQIVLFDRAGNVTAQSQVSPIPALGCGSQWSPDSQWITYLQGDNPGPQTATLLDAKLAEHAQFASADTTAPLFLPSGLPRLCGLAWSPDGSRLAYLDAAAQQVHVYSPDSGQDSIVASGNDKPVAWKSGNQLFIAQDFSTNEGGFQSYKIGLLDVATGSIVQVPNLDSGPGSPEEGINRQAWVSRDGSYVALLTRQGVGDFQGIGIYDMGSGQFAVIPQSSVSYGSDFIPPSYVWFSADSSKIFWWDQLAGLFSAPSAGGTVTNVAPLHAPGISSAPLYAPDLESVARVEFNTSGKRLILSRPDGTGEVEVASFLMATGESGSVIAWNPAH